MTIMLRGIAPRNIFCYIKNEAISDLIEKI